MGALYHPTPSRCSIAQPAPFIAKSFNPWHHPAAPHPVAHRAIVVPQVHAQWSPRVMLARLDHHAGEDLSDEFHVVPVPRCCHDREGQSLGIRKHTALDAAFTAVGWVGARFFPPNGVFVMLPIAYRNRLQVRRLGI